MMRRQILLPHASSTDATLENFIGRANQPLIQALAQLTTKARHGRVLYLWGERGSGKTHLLHAVCRRANIAGRVSQYLPLPQGAAQLGEAVVSDCLIGIDDVHYLAGDAARQIEMLSLYERLLAAGGVLVVTAQQPLGALGLTLKDLQSRLASGSSYRVVGLDDREKRLALIQRARGRGFVLSEPVVDFIMTHYRRDVRSLFTLLDKLDRASLQQQRKITIPLVKTLL